MQMYHLAKFFWEWPFLRLKIDKSLPSYAKDKIAHFPLFMKALNQQNTSAPPKIQT
jgi:hypothetical protein